MPRIQIIDQAAGAALGADCALALLADPMLDPLFRPQARSGIASAWHTHVPFAQWLVSVTRPALIVELGTHNGISYAAFCETVLQERLATRCYAVDSWAGDDHAGHYGDGVYAELRAFHDGRYAAFSELLRMTFDEARDAIADGSVDLLHIDGFHSYEAVRHDFDSWTAKLSPRAVVLFHDTNVLERGFGVARFWAEVEQRFPSFAFLHGHGLGVLAVGPDTPPAIARLCASVEPVRAAVLRERFAALGRSHGLDFALRETAGHEQRLRCEAVERDGVVASLRRSLDEVLSHRDALLAAQALAEQHLPAQEAMIASLRQTLQETALSLDGVRDQAARSAAAAQDRERQIADLRAQAAQNVAELDRLRPDIEALRGNLAAARADAKAGRAEATRLQAEIDRRDGEAAMPRSAAELGPIEPRLVFGLRPRRH
jgi:hypothetical protein